MRDSEILSTLAPLLGLSNLALNADNACAVLLLDGLDLDIQVLDACGELRLTLPLGEPALHARDATLAEALLANALLASASDRHLAWEADNERLVMCQTLRFESLAPDALRDAVNEFIETSRALRQDLQRSGMFCQ